MSDRVLLHLEISAVHSRGSSAVACFSRCNVERRFPDRHVYAWRGRGLEDHRVAVQTPQEGSLDVFHNNQLGRSLLDHTPDPNPDTNPDPNPNQGEI